MHVLVVGAGVGGLCLAQGLRKRGIGVVVLERDSAPDARAQGLRLKIDVHGRAALADCLDDDHYQLVTATANEPYQSRGVTLDENLNVLHSSVPAQPVDEATASIVVNRHTLRQILMSELTGHVFFGKEFERYELVDDRVVVYCRDGSIWVADVLVGADGINSAVRGQLVPDADVIDTGLWSIYGQLMLDEQNRKWLPENVFGGSRPVLGPQGRTLALGSFQPQMPIDQAIAQFASRAEISPVAPYLKWNLIAPAEQFGVSADEFFSSSPEWLHAKAGEMTAQWSPVVRRMLAESLSAVTFPLAIRASRPGAFWSTGRVTLLGDSAHATTPVGGVGANIALRDAAALAHNIAEVADFPDLLQQAIAQYEAAMREYGYQAVRNSLAGAERILRSKRLLDAGQG
ncbi:NAD(P)/FAD-dependent oxidoreductase [Streptomyces sp. NPDC004232]|uniref:FAD-dependent oxidoreductase n=1 Tax=Streptomyces sp. NPDC004232 TaxID=3154454 RepID=UPI0033AB73BB